MQTTAFHRVILLIYEHQLGQICDLLSCLDAGAINTQEVSHSPEPDGDSMLILGTVEQFSLTECRLTTV